MQVLHSVSLAFEQPGAVVVPPPDAKRVKKMKKSKTRLNRFEFFALIDAEDAETEFVVGVEARGRDCDFVRAPVKRNYEPVFYFGRFFVVAAEYVVLSVDCQSYRSAAEPGKAELEYVVVGA